MFALGIEFLTGTAVMTSADSREVAEWPPHPARVFMALVAAHYECRPLPEDGSDALETWITERKCLEWLEEKSAPEISFANVPNEHRRTVVNVYVPVNDQTIRKSVEADQGPFNGADIVSLRHRIDRTFPAVSTGIDAGKNLVHLVWKNATLPPELQAAFEMLTSKVIRIGHSSSLVSMWITESTASLTVTLTPVANSQSIRASMKLRGISPGLLHDLDQRFNAQDIDAFFNLSDRIQTSSGKAKAKAEEDFKDYFGEEWSGSLAAPVRLRPFVGISHAYVSPQVDLEPPIQTVFDSDILILSKHDGRVFGLESTNLLLEALRNTLLIGSEGAPSWFTGHKKQGEPSDTTHLALFPLAFVGSDYADGHILGLALAFPRIISEKERANQLKRFLFNELGENREITLKLGNLGEWTLQREDRSTRPVALRQETWTAASSVWASVTPVVLDRHSKFDPSDPKERETWRQETAEIIRASCFNIGLPAPIAVDIDRTSWHRGAPRSRPGPNGMPWLPSKSSGSRQQVHVLLQFDCEVEGPVLLGAGRYRGYGLCKPLGFPRS